MQTGKIKTEIRLKVFANYLGEKTVDRLGYNKMTPNRLLIIEGGGCDELQLVLKKLSTISDEDVMEVVKIEGLVNATITRRGNGSIKVTDDSYDFFILENYKFMLHKNSLEIPVAKEVAIYQFLQSRGYDTPHYLLGGKTLQEAGLAVYENK